MSKKEVFIDISARHVHLTREDLCKLFGEGYELTVYKDLGAGEFASEEQLSIVGPRSSFKKVRILGPCRSKTQIELSKTDARTIGVDAPVRISGDLAGSAPVKLIGPAGEIELESGAIVAKRHLHIGYKFAEEWGLKDGENIWIRVDSDGRRLIFGDVEIRVNTDDAEELVAHIDTDEANAAGMFPMNGYIVDIPEA